MQCGTIQSNTLWTLEMMLVSHLLDTER